MTGDAILFPLTAGVPGDCASNLCVFVKYLKLGSMSLGFNAVGFYLLISLEVFLCTGSHGNLSFLTSIPDEVSSLSLATSFPVSLSIGNTPSEIVCHNVYFKQA